MLDPRFLQYRPSQIAACAVIIAVNAYMKDREKALRAGAFVTERGNGPVLNQESFFKISDKVGANGKNQLLLNTDFWDGQQMEAVTGYNFDKIHECTIELCLFVKKNLKPDRLKGFDLSSLQEH